MGTDDASLVEWLGKPVHTVPGEADNIKITHPSDLLLAEWLLAENRRG
jgi:2-C-methyl-D-erythritol 4-phosphate cytidylyltransferase